MDSSKAKKAKSKARSRKSAQNQEAMMTQAMLQQAAMEGGMINPEVQTPVAAMQNMTQQVNPYGRMGAMAPNMYNPGNIVY